MIKRFIPLLLCALATLLGSCGGGSSSSPPLGNTTPPSTTTPVTPTVPVTPTPPPTPATPFNGNIVLGSPTTTSIKLKLYSPDQSGTVWLSYGATPRRSNQQSSPASLLAGQVLELSLDALGADQLSDRRCQPGRCQRPLPFSHGAPGWRELQLHHPG